MKRILFILFISISFLNFAQEVDSSNTLKAYTKSTNKIIKGGKFSKTEHLTPLSIPRNNENLADVLESQSTNYLKNYGPGNLSSISSRGGNAQQTSLIYKDFVLNNPLNGIVDFSSIPMVFFNSIDIIYGLPSSNWGNGGLASAVILENNNFAENKFIEYGNVFGSFGQKTNFLNLGLKNSKISGFFKIFHQKINNDYRFIDPESQLKRQTNASINHLALMGETNIFFNKRNNLSIVYFGQKLDREIPPSIYEGFTNARQEDDNHRLFLNYTHLKSNSKWSFKSAYYNEENNYIDSVRSIYGYNPAKSFINQLDFKSLFKSNHNLTINLTNSNSFSNGKNFSSNIEVNRTALTGSYIYKKKTWQQLLNFRILLNEGEITPLTYSYALNKTLNNASIFLNFGKVFRLPSINDLFWNPGGNYNLSPEQGYSSDIGFKWKTKLNNTFLSFSSSIYSRNIEDWIQWYPSGGYWSAMNIKKVWSRGIETSSSVKSQFRAIDFKLDFKTSYNLSTNIEIFNGDKSTINKQLIYSPFYKGVINASISFKNLNLSYLHNYTGYRFTTSDNNSYLPSFHIGKIYLSSDILIKNQLVKIFYKIHNIYNVDYQLIINRPMPLINHEIGINIKIKK